jgi:hypothetical protein
LDQLDLSDELDEYVFEEYCNAVYEMLLLDSPKWADSLIGAAKFETVKFQCELRKRFRERMFCFVEKIMFGEARRQLQRMGAGEMPLLRNYSEDWLPPYDKLRAELICTWLLNERRRKEMGKQPRGRTFYSHLGRTHPTLD